MKFFIFLLMTLFIKFNNTYLHLAVMSSQKEIIKLLLGQDKIDVNAIDRIIIIF